MREGSVAVLLCKHLFPSPLMSPPSPSSVSARCLHTSLISLPSQHSLFRLPQSHEELNKLHVFDISINSRLHCNIQNRHCGRLATNAICSSVQQAKLIKPPNGAFTRCACCNKQRLNNTQPAADVQSRQEPQIVSEEKQPVCSTQPKTSNVRKQIEKQSGCEAAHLYVTDCVH